MKNPRNFLSPLNRRAFCRRLVAGGAALTLAARGRSQSAPPKLGVALVGLGAYATKQLAPALRLTEKCRLMGVVTGKPDKGRQWAKEHGFPQGNIYDYDTMGRLADNPAIDIVYVVTPNALHARHVIAAAKAGKHVITEKPMGVSVAECDAMIAACRAANVRLSLGYRLHFDPFHEELRRLAQDREAGDITTLRGGFSFMMKTKVWRAERALAGGGPIMDLGIYVVQAACMAARGAAPVAVSASEGAKTKPEMFVDVEESMDWTMEFASGLKATGHASYQEVLNRVRAEAPGGWVEIEKAFAYAGLSGATHRGPFVVNPPVNQQARQLDDFAQCVREGRESRVSGEMGRRDMAIIEAIYRSAAAAGKRTPVKV